jgi:hypothetical protein
VVLALPFDGFEVRFVPGARALKQYVCPECTRSIDEGVGHVVAWPDDDNDARRHWHAHCWRHAVRRGRIDGI